MNHLLLTPDKLDVAAINDLVAHESCGAISLFVGTTRDNFESKEVVRLEYEAYETMAIKQMEEICQETRSKWPDIHDIAVHHRLGVVPVREASIVIAISSPHRQSALNAVAHCIDELKRRVPIWKKEVYADAESAWKENKELPLDFDRCSVEPGNDVPEQLVQICVAEDEIKRRIGCFVQKKREEIDLNNVLDFTAPTGEVAPESGDGPSTCARTDSVMVKQEHSKCHLRVKRVTNRCGPQTAPNSYQHTLDKLMMNNEAKWGNRREANATMQTHMQRLATIESHLGMAAAQSVSVHQRLKAVEDRILFLESISPEYKHFLKEEDAGSEESKRVKTEPSLGREIKREGYSVADIDTILAQLKQPA